MENTKCAIVEAYALINKGESLNLHFPKSCTEATYCKSSPMWQWRKEWRAKEKNTAVGENAHLGMKQCWTEKKLSL